MRKANLCPPRHTPTAQKVGASGVLQSQNIIGSCDNVQNQNQNKVRIHLGEVTNISRESYLHGSRDLYMKANCPVRISMIVMVNLLCYVFRNLIKLLLCLNK